MTGALQRARSPFITTRRDPEANARLRALIAEDMALLEADRQSNPTSIAPPARDEQPEAKRTG